jgi:hypothetical protein
MMGGVREILKEKRRKRMRGMRRKMGTCTDI